MSEYPEHEFPWNFYFNGELLPKWSACWGIAKLADYLHPEKDPCEDLSDRDIYVVLCTIDLVGASQSADPEVFLYAVQEILCLLLQHQDKVVAAIGENPHRDVPPGEIHGNLVEGAFRMRQLTLERGCAFWTSGYEPDRQRLLKAMRSAALPPSSPEYAPPPHVARVHVVARAARKDQVAQLHRLAQSGRFDKELRRRLHEIQPD